MAKRCITIKTLPNDYIDYNGITFIVALKGRESMIAGFTANIKQFYPEAHIIFAVQADNKEFNKGVLYNLGYKHSKTDIVIFSDVDIRYTHRLEFSELMQGLNCPFIGFDMISDIKDGEVRGACFRPSAYGGCAVFTRQQFEACGGYSNQTLVWGYGDAIINKRANFKRLSNTLLHIYHERNRDKSIISGAFEANRMYYENDNSDLDNYDTAEAKLINTFKDNKITWIEFIDLKNNIINTKLENNKEIGFTFIIPAYKASRFIEEALLSIENQPFLLSCNYEILLGIDNCQETLKTVESLNIKNLRVFYMDSNKGCYVIKNTLIPIAKYKYLFFFDADDILMPECLTTVNDYLQSYDIVRFSYFNFTNDNIEDKQTSSMVACGVFVCNSIVFNYFGGFKDWVCSADAEFQIRSIKNIENFNLTTIHLKNERLFYRRIHSDSLTRSNETGMNSELRLKYKNEITNTDNSYYTEPITNTFKEIKKISTDVITRFTFNKLEKIRKKLFVENLIPSLLKQEYTDFTLVLCTSSNTKIKKWIKSVIPNTIKYRFVDVTLDDLRPIEHVSDANIQIRLDYDDIVTEKYVSTIVNKWSEATTDSLVVTFAVTKYNIDTKKEYAPKVKYSTKLPSMFSALCQNTIEHQVYSVQHTELHKLAEKCIFIEEQNICYHVIHTINKSLENKI